MIYKHVLKITFSNEPELFFCTQLKDFKYCYITVQFNISHFLHA